MENRKRTMLIVDDEIGILKTLREVFEIRGWNIITTPTGASILPTMQKESIDVILLDIRLPDGSGLDALKNIRENDADIPIIIYTAYSYEDAVVNSAISLGASGYVSKSVPIQELIEVVNNAMVKK